jgi:hypothetical protein
MRRGVSKNPEKKGVKRASIEPKSLANERGLSYNRKNRGAWMLSPLNVPRSENPLIGGSHGHPHSKEKNDSSDRREEDCQAHHHQEDHSINSPQACPQGHAQDLDHNQEAQDRCRPRQGTHQG